MAGRSKKNCLTVERFFVRRREPVLVYRARICSSFLVKIKHQEHEIPNQVQNDRISSGSRDSSLGSREQKRLINSGYFCN